MVEEGVIRSFFDVNLWWDDEDGVLERRDDDDVDEGVRTAGRWEMKDGGCSVLFSSSSSSSAKLRRDFGLVFGVWRLC